MLSIINTVIEKFNKGEDAVLCSIIASSGSTPRGAGAKMVVFQDGSSKGTIGGGNVELICLKKAQNAIQEKKSFVDSYSLNKNEINDIGMICGGTVVVYFQYLDHNDSIIREMFIRLKGLITESKDAWMINYIPKNSVTSLGIYSTEAGLEYINSEIEPEIIRMIKNNRHLSETENRIIYIEPLSCSSRLYLFGGGHVGKALAPVLQKIEFNVIIFDNRPELIKPENTPGALEIIYGDYENIFDKISINKNDYAVVMTPGHQSDIEILNQLLKTDATYIGCIGSRRKVAITKEKLSEYGHSEENISRINSPIGLSIGAKTPEEIAISIAAELIQHRAESSMGDKNEQR